MQLTGQEILTVARAEAWAALNDLERVPAISGGSKLRFTHLNPPSSVQIAIDAAAGHDSGTAHVRLEALGPERTLLHYTVVGGEGAQQQLRDLFKAFGEALRQRHAVARADAAPVEPPKSAFQQFLAWYLGWLGRIFTGKV